MDVNEHTSFSIDSEIVKLLRLQAKSLRRLMSLHGATISPELYAKVEEEWPAEE